jgi:hypothetical protein
MFYDTGHWRNNGECKWGEKLFLKGAGPNFKIRADLSKLDRFEDPGKIFKCIEMAYITKFWVKLVKKSLFDWPQQVAKTRKYVYNTGHRSQSSKALYIVMTVS